MKTATSYPTTKDEASIRYSQVRQRVAQNAILPFCEKLNVDQKLQRIFFLTYPSIKMQHGLCGLNGLAELLVNSLLAKHIK